MAGVGTENQTQIWNRGSVEANEKGRRNEKGCVQEDGPHGPRNVSRVGRNNGTADTVATTFRRKL